MPKRKPFAWVNSSPDVTEGSWVYSGAANPAVRTRHDQLIVARVPSNLEWRVSNLLDATGRFLQPVCWTLARTSQTVMNCDRTCVAVQRHALGSDSTEKS